MLSPWSQLRSIFDGRGATESVHFKHMTFAWFEWRGDETSVVGPAAPLALWGKGCLGKDLLMSWRSGKNVSGGRFDGLNFGGAPKAPTTRDKNWNNKLPVPFPAIVR